MKLSVLFIGNSHTYLNYMPQMLVALASAEDRGFELAADQCTGEGASLAWHWNHPQSRDAIARKPWDYVVLQERSGGPLEEPDSFMQHADLLDAAIKKQGAQTVLYMTWANRSKPATQVLLTGAYTKLAKELGTFLAPVGQAWEAVHRIDSGIELYHDDGRHANSTGSYLTACVFYSVLFNASPEGLPGTFSHKGKKRLDLEKDKALLLQKAAWEMVSILDSGFRISD